MTITVTNRRTFLTVAAGLAAALTTLGLAIARVAPDPIHAAIANHRDAVDRTGLTSAYAEVDDHQIQIALQAELGAATALISTVPTTRTGLQALEKYLRGGARLLGRIERPVMRADGSTYIVVGGPGEADWIIARHAAAMA